MRLCHALGRVGLTCPCVQEVWAVLRPESQPAAQTGAEGGLRNYILEQLGSPVWSGDASSVGTQGSKQEASAHH